MDRLLDNKTAIVYGGGGHIGSGVARTFAAEGATVFLVGRTLETLERVAAEIASSGGSAHVAALDCLDEDAVERHAKAVVDQRGGIDAAINLASRGDVQGTRLLDTRRTTFCVRRSRGCARILSPGAWWLSHGRARIGAILMLTSGSGPAWTPPEVWPMGGTGPADAAIESFMRYLASEVGPHGVRVNCLWTAGVVLENDPLNPAKDMLVNISMLRKRPTMQEVADTAAFVVSDRGKGITASIVNVTSGISAL